MVEYVTTFQCAKFVLSIILDLGIVVSHTTHFLLIVYSFENIFELLGHWRKRSLSAILSTV